MATTSMLRMTKSPHGVVTYNPPPLEWQPGKEAFLLSWLNREQKIRYATCVISQALHEFQDDYNLREWQFSYPEASRQRTIATMNRRTLHMVKGWIRFIEDGGYYYLVADVSFLNWNLNRDVLLIDLDTGVHREQLTGFLQCLFMFLWLQPIGKKVKL